MAKRDWARKWYEMYLQYVKISQNQYISSAWRSMKNSVFRWWLTTTAHSGLRHLEGLTDDEAVALCAPHRHYALFGIEIALIGRKSHNKLVHCPVITLLLWRKYRRYFTACDALISCEPSSDGLIITVAHMTIIRNLLYFTLMGEMHTPFISSSTSSKRGKLRQIFHVSGMKSGRAP